MSYQELNLTTTLVPGTNYEDSNKSISTAMRCDALESNILTGAGVVQAHTSMAKL